MLSLIVLQLWISLLICLNQGSCHDEAGDMHDVIIIGAGPAGIRTAARLQELGITNIKILERTDRSGGIIRSGNLNGYTVELGAARIWESNTEMLALANQFISTMLHPPMPMVFNDDYVHDVTSKFDESLERYNNISQLVDNYAQTIRRNNYPDISLINAYKWMGFNATSPIDRTVLFLNQNTRDDTALESLIYRVEFKGRVYLTTEGGDGMAKMIAEYARQNIMEFESKVELNTLVSRIETREDRVTVYTQDDHFDAKNVIVAYSMGELQHQSMIFDPPLPDWKLHAIHGYAVTEYIKIFLRFPEESWFIPDDVFRFGLLSERVNYYMFWQNVEHYHNGSRIVGCFVKNDQAMQLRNMTDDQIKEEMVAVLRAMFGDAVPDAEEILVPRGDDDPLLYGGHSYWPTGFTMAQHAALKAAVGQVHFVGDYYMGNSVNFPEADWTAAKMVADNVHSCMSESTAEPEVCGSFRPAYMARGCTYELALNYDPGAKKDDGSCRLVGLAPGSASHVAVSLAVMLVALFSLLLVR